MVHIHSIGNVWAPIFSVKPKGPRRHKTNRIDIHPSFYLYACFINPQSTFSWRPTKRTTQTLSICIVESDGFMGRETEATLQSRCFEKPPQVQ
ncbi:uncharacterized protein G2W53_000380 [Senna tora]|uniref:Uncharacterized protein n=1 Tax=Senna tora TaxID=362788 RepID=A0A834XDN7_9FABA|nr:uncharacterized protein G2W53_000380 [Senna tora]